MTTPTASTRAEPADGRLHWLSAAQRRALLIHVAAARPTVTSPLAAIHLDNVLLELAVAEARAATWPAVLNVRHGADLEPDALPVHLTAGELAVLLHLPLGADLASRLIHSAFADLDRLAADARS